MYVCSTSAVMIYLNNQHLQYLLSSSLGGSKMQSAFESLPTKGQSRQLSMKCAFFPLSSFQIVQQQPCVRSYGKEKGNIQSYLEMTVHSMWTRYFKLKGCVSARMAHLHWHSVGNCTILQDFTSGSSCHVHCWLCWTGLCFGEGQHFWRIVWKSKSRNILDAKWIYFSTVMVLGFRDIAVPNENVFSVNV